MSMANRVEALLLVGTLAAASVAGLRWHRSQTAITYSKPSRSALEFPIRVARDSLEVWADVAVERDAFRLSREPAALPYSRTPASGPQAPLVRPSFVLKGIIGPPWVAILDGLPGAPPGAVVQSGATFDKIVIRRVTRDSVVIQGADTIWRLTLPRGGENE